MAWHIQCHPVTCCTKHKALSWYVHGHYLATHCTNRCMTFTALWPRYNIYLAMVWHVQRHRVVARCTKHWLSFAKPCLICGVLVVPCLALVCGATLPSVLRQLETLMDYGLHYSWTPFGYLSIDYPNCLFLSPNKLHVMCLYRVDYFHRFFFVT